MGRACRRPLLSLVAASAMSVTLAVLVGCGGGSGSQGRSLAAAIERNDVALRRAIDDWRAGGDPPSTPPPSDVRDDSAELQDEVGFLGEHPAMAAQVIPALDGSVHAEIQRLYGADRALIRLSAGSGHVQLHLGPREPLSNLTSYYHEAERRYGVSADYLAAINLVETKFGRVVSNSVAGAQGPMQFIPTTWATYGHGGDIHDPHDAILGAARLLQANGAPDSYGPALRAYNPSGLYVEAVTQYAKEMAADPDAIYFLYAWEP
jgi:soluble lytic murein transglycosylase-like protein